MKNEEMFNALKATAARLEKDIAAHENYLKADPSLEYHHYVAMVKPEDAIGCKDWTVRLTCNGAQLQKNTTAENFAIFTTRQEATAAAKSLRLVDANGNRVKHTYEIVTCTEWHRAMIDFERESLASINHILKSVEA